MKRIFLFVLFCVGVMVNAVAQSEAIYIFKKDGTVQSFLKEEFNKVSYSHYDANNVFHDEIVSQEIEGKDGLSRILLEDIDSVRLIAPKVEKSINPAYVPIDWNNVSLTKCDRENFTFQLKCNGDAPNIVPSSVITVNEDSIMHIVLVTKVDKNGDFMTIKGYPGSLGNLFFDTEFVVKTLEPNKTERAKAVSVQNHGNYYVLNHRIDWNYPGKIDFIKGGSTKDKASYVDYNTNLYLELTLKFRFGDKVETIMDGITFLCAKYFDIDTNLTGGVKWVVDYTGEFNSKNINIDLAPNEDDKYELIPVKIPEAILTLPIGPLLIPIMIGGDLYKQVKLDVKNTHGKFTAGFDALGEGTIGFRYNGITGEGTGWYGGWKFVPNRHDPTVEGYIETESKFYIFPRIHAWISGAMGPSIDIKPYLRTNITGGFRTDIVETQKEDYLAWSLTNAAGVDWALGWSTSAWGTFEGSNKQLYSDTFTKNDWILYHSPWDIKYISSSDDVIKKDNPLDVTFEVSDSSFLGKLPTCLPQVVKFECNSGTVNGDMGCFSFAKDGKVTAKWNPGSSTDVLYARMYDMKGKVIAEDSFGDDLPVAITGDSTNIKSNSAEVNCTFLRVPKGALCGVDYWTHGEDANIGTKTIEFVGDSITHTFVLDDLLSNTEYSYCAYIKIDDKYIDGEEKQFRTESSLCPDAHHPHMIDLGLPSGTRWACCNVDATTPEGAGGYYSWGETYTKSGYRDNNYSYFIKYQDSKYDDSYVVPIYAYIGTDISGTEYDVAHVKWGEAWRIPTMYEIKELKSNCSSLITIVNGVQGRLYTGPNGNQVFLPALGSYYDGFDNDSHYWSSTLDPSETNCEDSKYGWYPYVLDIDNHDELYCSRGYGFQVRPVNSHADPNKAKPYSTTDKQVIKNEVGDLEPIVTKDNVVRTYIKK